MSDEGGVVERPRLPMPVYKTPRGGTRKIEGYPAESWPHPRVIEYDGTVFVEWVLPYDTDWGLTFHCVRNRAGHPIRSFFATYVEGRASGFPWWPTFVLSARWAIRDLFRI